MQSYCTLAPPQIFVSFHPNTSVISHLIWLLSFPSSTIGSIVLVLLQIVAFFHHQLCSPCPPANFPCYIQSVSSLALLQSGTLWSVIHAQGLLLFSYTGLFLYLPQMILCSICPSYNFIWSSRYSVISTHEFYYFLPSVFGNLLCYCFLCNFFCFISQWKQSCN